MEIGFALTILAVVGQWIFFSSTAQAHPASGIVVDRAGNIYFSDLETIWKFDTRGKLTVFRSGKRGRHVHELAIDEQDNVYGGDVSYRPSTEGWISDVWKMTPDGKLIYLLEPTEHPPRGMSIWRDRAGNMYFIDQNNHTKRETLLLRRSPDGTVTTFAGGAYGDSTGGVEVVSRSEPPYFPTGVAAAGGNLYVLEVGFTLPNLTSGPRVRKITAAGKSTILSTIGENGSAGKPGSSLALQAGTTAESAIVFFSRDGRLKYSIAFVSVGIVSLIALVRQRRRRART